MIPKDCKRLAEVDFPIAEVSRHAAREKSIRHGHPSTLHLWWARRPLASSRAVLLALLWPDPCDPLCPAEFKRRRGSCCRRCQAQARARRTRTCARRCSSSSRTSRTGIIAAQPHLSGVSRALVKAAHGEEPPLVVDPFAGGGSIPLEALRLGCEAFASDLNPVACLILKVMLEDIPRHGPELAEELRRVGAEIKKAGGEGAGRPLSEGPGRCDAHRLPVGADSALRVAELRRGDPARALVLALQEGKTPAGAAASRRATRGRAAARRVRDLRAEDGEGSA